MRFNPCCEPLESPKLQQQTHRFPAEDSDVIVGNMGAPGCLGCGAVGLERSAALDVPLVAAVAGAVAQAAHAAGAAPDQARQCAARLRRTVVRRDRPGPEQQARSWPLLHS